MGTSDKEIFAQFNQGALIELKLFGSESTWWAPKHKHDASRKTAYKRMVPAADRREQANILVDLKHQMQISVMQLSSQKQIVLPFSIPLPDNLPSSFIYCGQQLSILTVSYNLETSFLGLSGQMPSPTA